MLLLPSPNGPYRRCSPFFRDEWPLKMASRCFFLLGSPFIKPNNIALVNVCLFLQCKLHCLRQLLLYIFCFCQFQTQALIRTCSSAFFLLCLTPAVTRKTHYGISTLLTVPTYMLAFSLGIAFRNARKIWFQFFGSVLS